jgi:hypothetical protein
MTTTIEFQHRVLDGHQRLFKRRQLLHLFLSQSVTVLRAMPKVRVNPRRELRSP